MTGVKSVKVDMVGRCHVCQKGNCDICDMCPVCHSDSSDWIVCDSAIWGSHYIREGNNL